MRGYIASYFLLLLFFLGGNCLLQLWQCGTPRILILVHFVSSISFIVVVTDNMGSSPKFPIQSHALVCIKNYLFIVVIGPICDKELVFIFDMFLLFEDRYKYYKINIIHKSVFVFCYNVVYLQCLVCFGADTDIFSVLLVYILFCIQNQSALVTTIKEQLYIFSTKHQISEQ